MRSPKTGLISGQTNEWRFSNVESLFRFSASTSNWFWDCLHRPWRVDFQRVGSHPALKGWDMMLFPTLELELLTFQSQVNIKVLSCCFPTQDLGIFYWQLPETSQESTFFLPMVDSLFFFFSWRRSQLTRAQNLAEKSGIDGSKHRQRSAQLWDGSVAHLFFLGPSRLPGAECWQDRFAHKILVAGTVKFAFG